MENEEDSDEDDDCTGGAEDSEEDDSDEDEFDEEEGDDEQGPDDPEELLETYFQGLKAKKKLKDLGYSRRPASTGGKRDRKKNSTCKDCKGKGHWSGDSECPKVKDGTVAPFVPKVPAKPKVSFAGMATGGPARWQRDADKPMTVARVLAPAPEPHTATTDLSGYSVDALRKWLERKKLSAKGERAEPEKRVSDYMSRRASRQPEAGWEWTTLETARITDGEPDCQHRRVRDDSTATNTWRVCPDCDKRLSATNRTTAVLGVTNYFIGCSSCDSARKPWWAPRTKNYNCTTQNHAGYDSYSYTPNDPDIRYHDYDASTHVGNCHSNDSNNTGSKTDYDQEGHGAHHVVSYGVNHADTSGKAIPDSGCRKSVAGRQWHGHMRKVLAEHGLTPLYRPITEHFKFGDGHVEVSKVAWTYPVGLYGAHGTTIDIAEVNSACPSLLSIEAIEELGIVLNLLNKTVSIENAKVYNQPMERASSGHPVILLTDFSHTETFPDESLVYHADPVYPMENETPENVKRGAPKRLARIANSLAEVFEASHEANEKQQKRRPGDLQLDATNHARRPRGYGWEGGNPLSIETGYDNATAAGQQAAWDAYVNFAPHVAILAFPCDPWSKMQNMNMKDPSRRARILNKSELHRPLRFTEQVCRRQHCKGLYYVVENPSGSTAWQERPMQGLKQYSDEVIVYMCTQGLCDPWSGEPLRKSTRLMTNSRQVVQTFRRCRCKLVCQMEPDFTPHKRIPRTSTALKLRAVELRATQP